MTPGSINLSPYRQALEALQRALAQPKTEYLRDSVIQRFEFTYELAWKALKRFLEQEEGAENVDALQRRDLYRMAAEKGLIGDPVAWFGYHRARNETVHTYQEAKADEVYAIAATFVKDAIELLANLEKRVS
ncbi:MAG: nucleotidyltransferase substrate binding protein [Fibrobacteria bacterium]